MKKVESLIVLDSLEYKAREGELVECLKDLADVRLYYTKYESKLTELFQRTKGIGGFLTHISCWLMSFLYACKLLLRRYNYKSTIVFVNPLVGIFYCLLARLLFIRQNIAVAGFLFEMKRNNFYLRIREAFVNFCYRDVRNLFVYGETEVEQYNLLFPKLKGKFEYVRYGRDFRYKNKKDFVFNRPYIASGGRSNRNFETLCSAFGILKEQGSPFDCLIATRPECVTSSMKKTPVIFQYGITLNQFGSFIEHSTIFVLPLLDTRLSAGHMAMMEAMANEKPIIVTDIPAIRDYVSESQVTFYKPGDAEDLAGKISNVVNNVCTKEVQDKVRQAKLLYEKDYSFNALLRRIVLKTIPYACSSK